MTAALLLTPSIVELDFLTTEARAQRKALAALARLDLDVVVLRGAGDALLDMADLMGCRPHAYADMDGGLLVSEIEAPQRLHSACAHLPMPGESHHPASPSPDFVFFGRSAAAPAAAPAPAAMDLVVVSDMFHRLPGKVLDELKALDYAGPGPMARTSILYRDGSGRCMVRYDEAQAEGATLAARRALQTFRDRLADPALRRQVALEPGDLMLVNNRSVVTAGGGRVLRLFASRPKSFPYAVPAADQPHLWLT